MLENQILRILPHRIRETISAEHLQYMFLQEIRLRMEKPLLLIYRGEERMPLIKSGRPYLVTKEDLKEALEYIKADELVEVTPKSMRMRKTILDHNERKKANK